MELIPLVNSGEGEWGRRGKRLISKAKKQYIAEVEDEGDEEAIQEDEEEEAKVGRWVGRVCACGASSRARRCGSTDWCYSLVW